MADTKVQSQNQNVSSQQTSQQLSQPPSQQPSQQPSNDKLISSIENLTKELQFFHKDVKELTKTLQKNKDTDTDILTKIGKDLTIVKKKFSPSDDYLNMYELMTSMYDMLVEKHKKNSKEDKLDKNKNTDKKNTPVGKNTTKKMILDKNNSKKNEEEDIDSDDDAIKDVKNITA